MKDNKYKMIEETINVNKDVLERLSVVEKQEQQINDLISLSLWSIRRLHKSHQVFGYKELVSIVGKEHPNLDCVKDELEGLVV